MVNLAITSVINCIATSSVQSTSSQLVNSQNVEDSHVDGCLFLCRIIFWRILSIMVSIMMQHTELLGVLFIIVRFSFETKQSFKPFCLLVRRNFLFSTKVRFPNWLIFDFLFCYFIYSTLVHHHWIDGGAVPKDLHWMNFEFQLVERFLRQSIYPILLQKPLVIDNFIELWCKGWKI